MTDQIIQSANLPLCVTKETCTGGTYIVTGANTGLGYEAAKHLVSLGASKVVLAVRNITLGAKAKAEIEAATGTSNIAEVWELDLASYDSVKSFAKKAITELDRIDALIENAGVAAGTRVLAEGHLINITVNVLSTLLLAVLLLPKMSESAKKFGILPHLAIVSSGASFAMEADWNTIKDDPLVGIEREDLPAMKTYPLSKLLEIFGVYYLATLIPVSHTGVVVNLVDPGLCNTELSKDAPPPLRQHILEMQAKVGRTPEVGSRTLLHGAIAGKESHGALLQSCEISE
ncbi:Short chain dehydrogenase [Lachnellula occidentalis]|uniref:Short chain dehydrogenase n=1 Tax=Lachnellula occidentalis TaxID=215460 RepID=A0A8H8S7B5_9HELO|nr:Short chain dehydrogenase [Lachnellula occidentalis]